MALSDEMLAAFGREHGFGCTVADEGYHCDTLWYDGNPTPFARAIEAEVRKDDTELIQQLVEALESVDDAMPFPVARQVLKAARARLEGKP